MSYKFSQRSLDNLSTCHPDLIRLMNEVIKHIDITVLCGHRGEAAQNLAFANHTSQLKWPHGNHNKIPSLAVDIAPWPVDWDNEAAFYTVAHVVKHLAEKLGIPIVWGGDWKGFKDLPHYELKRVIA